MVAIKADMRIRRSASGRTQRAAARLGENLLTWRKLQGLTAQQVADRANISRPTLRRLENGQPAVSMETFLGVLRALGQLDRVVDALDPYGTELGRARADSTLPKRVRR